MIQNFFGFQKVSPEERTRKVQNVFESVANRYDLMNDLMSLGIHRYWKDRFVSHLPITCHSQILDVAGGTGDIAFKILGRYPHLNPKVTLCDLSLAMLKVGQDRALDRGIVRNVDWVCGNAESLPLPDNGFDLYTISFGLRNVTHLETALREAYRVLKPGGYFVCLEFSKVQSGLLEKLYTSYSFNVLPKLGEFVAKDRDSYQYLVESIQKFPSQEVLGALVEKAGFEDVHWQNFLSGVSSIHRGRKPLY
jgi:ubiquinone/menaquinone biosynthesis methyltransferase